MSEQILAPNEQMMQWITAKWITKPIYIIAELGIADRLCDGPKSVASLAEETHTHAPTLFRILRALASVGVFAETEDRVFGLTPLARCLCSDALRPIARMFLSEWHDKAWNGLIHTVRTGEPGFDYTFGKPAFEWFEENPEERSILDQAQGSKVVGFAKAVIENYDFSDVASICDIGGGQGTFLLQLLAAHPHISGIVADLPGAVLAAEKAIAKKNLGGRCKAIAYDFNKAVPPACDGYLLINVLHDWDDEICIRLLNNIAKAMNPDTKLWIIEFIIAPGQGFSVAKLLDIEVLVMSGGRERTMDEYKALVNAAGLAMSKTLPMENGTVLMECAMKS